MDLVEHAGNEGNAVQEVNVIDLTNVDTSDEEEKKRDVRDVQTDRNAVMKFTFIKRTRSSRLQIVRPGFAEKIYVSLFSNTSKIHLNELMDASKRTYTGSSMNPFIGNALFAAEVIEEGELICLYLGNRMPLCEANARIDAGQSSEYMIDITSGVVIDGIGVGMGAAMANHSCCPNAELQHKYLRGYERAPICILRAIQRIKVGDEIETNYHLFDPNVDEMPNLSDTDKYVPCKCLRPNCIGVYKLKE